MTNAEKYLKDEVSAFEFRQKLANFMFENLGLYEGTKGIIDEAIGDFLDNIEKPILTEDERVILRNIDKRYKLICKDNVYNLFVKNGTYDLEKINPLNKLFQFIKPRRRI